MSEEEELQRRTGGRWESWQDDLAHDDGRGDLQNQLQEIARLQQNGSSGQQTSYSSVSYAGTGVTYITNTRSNLPLVIHTPTTTRRYPTSLSKGVRHTQAFETHTEHQHDHRKSKSTDPLVPPLYHRLYHLSPQHHEILHSNTRDRRPYQENTQTPTPIYLLSPAKYPTTALQHLPPNSTTSPSSRPPTSKMATLCAQYFSPINSASSSSMLHLQTHVSISKRAACSAAS